MESRVMASRGRYRGDVAVEWDELRLLWPAELFRAEAYALADRGQLDDEHLGWLIDEAFHGGMARRWWVEQMSDPRRQPSPDNLTAMLARLPILSNRGGATGRPGPGPEVKAASRVVVRTILDALAQVPQHEPPRLWSARQGLRGVGPKRPAPLSSVQLRQEFAEVVGSLDTTGYFERAFGSRCTDTSDDPAAEGQRRLAELIDSDGYLWPLWDAGQVSGVADAWSDETLFDVVEALHLFVARPRRRYWHEFERDYDYDDHTRSAGQAVYRWQVNNLLARSDVPWRLAVDGPDRGRLVAVTGDPRDDLVRSVLEDTQENLQGASPAASELEGGSNDAVAHAIELFRARDAGREAKRSAIVTLAGVLENRRDLLKDRLMSGDESALFHIANKFHLRHRTEEQRGEYAHDFLDWVFWWYLATIELTNRLLVRAPSQDVHDSQPARDRVEA